MEGKYSGRRFYTMYHGTSVEAAHNIINNGFAVSNDGMLGRGVYASRDVEKASRYPLNTTDPKVVLKLSVRVGKVKKIDSQDHPMRLTWHDHGYDTAWMPPECGMVPSGLQENCIFDPWRIKIVDVVPPALRNWTPKVPFDRKIYVMYHGTTLKAAIQIVQNGFVRSRDGMLGPGVYVSRDIDKAARYPLGDQRDQVILKLRVNVGRVKMIDCQGHKLQKTWHEEGYDTAWVPAYCGMVKSGLEEDCIWDPKRIKVVGIAKSPQNMLQYLNQLLKK
ncbi:uncharacterized protein [Dendrobates tinctorius]|uniref:uncharacterized protein n=1 Tax=Dendrobates tinctorius TaxID=92724 RepID=UPI003CC94082